MAMQLLKKPVRAGIMVAKKITERNRRAVATVHCNTIIIGEKRNPIESEE
jgi:hypothetical protein